MLDRIRCPGIWKIRTDVYFLLSHRYRLARQVTQCDLLQARRMQNGQVDPPYPVVGAPPRLPEIVEVERLH